MIKTIKQSTKLKAKMNKFKFHSTVFICSLLIVSSFLPSVVYAYGLGVSSSSLAPVQQSGAFGVGGGTAAPMQQAGALGVGGGTAAPGSISGVTAAAATPSGAPVMDKSNTMVNLAGVIKDIVKFVAEVAYAKFRKQLLDTMVDQIIKWIQGGGEPLFVADFGSFINGVADEAGGKVLASLVSSDTLNLLCSPSWGIKAMITLQEPPIFATKAKCSISTLVNNQTEAYNDFMTDFKKGGWKSWIKVSETKNNMYGFYLMALDEKITKEANAMMGAKEEGTMSGGFLGDKVCRARICYVFDTSPSNYGNTKEVPDTGIWKKEDVSTGGENCKCTKWETKTPGHLAAEALSKASFKDIDWLITNEEAASYVIAITDALVNRLIKEGVGLIQSSQVGGGGPDYQSYDMYGNPIGQPVLSDFFDETAPTTELAIYDPWRVQLRVAADSDDPDRNVTIKFTVDGSRPDRSTTAIISASPTLPIVITKPITIRWIGVDKELNEEDAIHEADLSPLFAGPYVSAQSVQAPFTAAVVLDYNHIALVSDKSANIYYTINGQTPALDSSNLYVQVIEVPTDRPLTIKWFGWLAAAGMAYQEPMHTLRVQAPLPSGAGVNNELLMTGDLSTINPLPGVPVTSGGGWPPTATFYTPSSVPSNTFFTLDPSLSSAYEADDAIVLYEWDFDHDGVYDWFVADPDADGVFDDPVCVHSQLTPPNQTCSAIQVGTGFMNMTIPSGGSPGELDVQYGYTGNMTIILRVTDNNGLVDTRTQSINP